MTERKSSGADEIAEAQERERRIVRDLNKQRLVSIIGVVSPGGGDSSRFKGDDYWTFRYSLEFWRMNGGDVQARKTLFGKQVGKEEREALFDQLKPNPLLRCELVFWRVVTSTYGTLIAACFWGTLSE